MISEIGDLFRGAFLYFLLVFKVLFRIFIILPDCRNLIRFINGNTENFKKILEISANYA